MDYPSSFPAFCNHVVVKNGNKLAHGTRNLRKNRLMSYKIHETVWFLRMKGYILAHDGSKTGLSRQHEAWNKRCRIAQGQDAHENKSQTNQDAERSAITPELDSEDKQGDEQHSRNVHHAGGYQGQHEAAA